MYLSPGENSWRKPNHTLPTRVAKLPVDPIGNPVRVPPLDWIHRAAMDEHREVQMIAAGEPGHAAPADLLAALDRVAGLHLDRGRGPVDRRHARPGVDDHAVAVDAQPARVQPLA